MQGFQYTNNVLDFFPHPEGYAKALPASLGGGSSYQFKYVFTYTDHLGNIRLKYAQDPSNNNRISILEEDHYYPYGLKHSGYNSFHQIFATEDGDGPGTGIVLTPVNPFLGDSHKYKFGGMEYSDEFDINTYDFGARNYDPALGRWMNVDPLAEMMRRHSPYNYAFNNPVYFIDPDGMMPGGFGGLANVDLTTSTGSFDSFGGSNGFDVRTYDKDGKTLDFVTVNDKQGVDIRADGEITKNDRQTPQDPYKQANLTTDSPRTILNKMSDNISRFIKNRYKGIDESIYIDDFFVIDEKVRNKTDVSSGNLIRKSYKLEDGSGMEIQIAPDLKNRVVAWNDTGAVTQYSLVSNKLYYNFQFHMLAAQAQQKVRGWESTTTTYVLIRIIFEKQGSYDSFVQDISNKNQKK